MTIQLRVAAIRLRVQTLYEEVEQLIEGPIAALAAGELYRSSLPGKEWTLMENLAHIGEFLPYWGKEFALLVAAPGRSFGRTAEHEGRLRAISDHARDDLARARNAIDEGYISLDRVLISLRDDDLELTGRHIKFGEQTLDWFIDEFVIRHLANHLLQMRELLSHLEARG
jgi:hypothetical protein